MRKVISLISVLIIILTVFSGCSGESGDKGKIKIVTTVFPLFDWTENVLGENSNADVTMLLESGADLHNYQPTADDMIKISSCDVFIYVGGESEKWVNDALKQSVNKEMKVLNLIDALGEEAKTEETVDGMEAEDEEENEAPEVDEHIWLSLKNAQIAVNAIADTLTDADSENADTYKQNAKAYNTELSALDKKYEGAVKKAENKTILFGDRFPFRYLADDYGIKYYAAFSGCSAETEASFETVTFLAKKVDELNLPAVLTIEGTKHKIAETIVSNTKRKNQQVLSLDSMQSVTADGIKNGVTYLSVMEKNLEILVKALG